MEPNAYAEYKSESIGIIYLNGTYEFGEINQIIFRWECIELDDDTAKLNISVSFEKDGRKIQLSNNVYVDIINRDVSLLNGKIIGTTRLWFPANPSQGEELIIWDLPPERIVGTADTSDYENSIVFATIQGAQNFFSVDGQGIMMGEQIRIDGTTCDFDTGVTLFDFFLYEPLLLALDIKEIIGSSQLTDTNISLGPRELSYDIRAALPVVAIIITAILVFVVIYKKRKKGRNI